LADVQAGLTGQQYGALSQGYTQAMKGALDEASLLNQTAGTQGKLADIEQNEALTGAGALTKAGAERQAYQQSLLDAPLKTATTASGLMRGFTVPGGQTSTFVGPKAGSYQNSDLANITGVLSMLGSTAGGKGLQTVAGAGSGLIDYLKGLTSGNGNTNLFGGYKIDPSEFAGANADGVGVYYDTATGKYYDSSGNVVPVTGD
jgi:hypothetical protein